MSMPVKFTETEIEGVLVVETGLFKDNRGSFSEVYSHRTWADAGFGETFLQDNFSRSAKGTLRGMHYQLEPHGMGKLVRVAAGAVFDVAVDLRKGSPTLGKWVGRELSEYNGLAMWIPVGFAHGFLALERDTTVFYKCTNFYTPEAERSLSYKDSQVAIKWPAEPSIISEKDLAAPGFDEAEYNFNF